MKDDKLSNMFSLLKLLCRPQGCSVREAMKELHCASKTFYRILKTFEELHIPFEKHSDVDGPTNSQRYLIEEKYLGKFGAKILRFSTAEYFLLKYLLRKDTLLHGSTMMPVVDSMREKLDNLTFSDTKGSSAAIYVSDKHRRHYDKIQQDIFSTIMEALERHVELKVTYTGAPDMYNRRTTREFLFHPYTFLDHNGAFYVVGTWKGYGNPCVFSLDRFSSAAIAHQRKAMRFPKTFPPRHTLRMRSAFLRGKNLSG